MKSRILQLTTLLFVLVITCQMGYTQVPDGFNYQAVIRNSTGQPLASQNVSVKITLTDNTGTPSYYSEIHTTQTNAQGIVTLIIGAGTVQGQGVLSNVAWSSGNIWIKVEVDNGSGYILMGLNKLQSVPYAQYAINGTWANEHTITSTANVGVDDPIFEVKNKLGQIVFGVYEGGVRVYVEDVIAKGSKGGFAVGGLSNKTATTTEYFRITPDSARIWTKAIPTAKGAKGGFAVGGLSSKGTSDDYFNVTPITSPLIIDDNAQMLWYPLKEAFLVGRVQVLDPADVGFNSFASGYHSKAKGNYSQAMGYNTVASNTYATAIGESCLASGEYSFAFGSQAQATNTNNIAIGYQAESSGSSDCYAFGKLAKVLTNSSNSYAFGNSAQVLGYSTNSYALGNTSLVTGSTDSYAFGTNASVVNGYNAYAIGSYSQALPMGISGSSWGSYAIGDHAQTIGQRAYAMGSHARALYNDAIAIGSYSKSTNYLSIAIGANGSTGDTTQATGQASIAFGAASIAQGDGSITMGTRTLASSNYGIGIRLEAKSNAMGALSLGYQTVSNGGFSISIGRQTTASNLGSMAIGYFAATSGDNSLALGSNATASGTSSIAVSNSTASGDYSTAIGNGANASGKYSVALGNSYTSSSADNSVAIGNHVNTGTHPGSIAIGDGSSSIDLISSIDNQFLLRAAGGIYLYTNSGLTSGVYLSSGGGAWNIVSDVKKKNNFKDENPEEYLNKLSKINIQSWNYKSQNEAIRHIGITAQDFYKNFQFGESDTTINEVDLAGINMISIKGLINRNSELTQKVTDQSQKIESLEKELASLKSQVEIIKKFLAAPQRNKWLFYHWGKNLANSCQVFLLLSLFI